MALYQPSNITPSTFAGIGGGVIDANDNVSISWQVNGTSGMTAFSIAVYQNNTSSTLVHTFSSGALSTPFYGTDGAGNVQFYVYEPGTTWAAAGLTNGNEYKLKITMQWDGGSVVQTSESVFRTRATPSLSVSPSTGTLTSVAETFTGSYSQAQGDAITWARWTLTDAEGDVLDDTGAIYTGVLSYSYDGFFNGQTYLLTLTVETASGMERTVTNTYAVSYSSAPQSGGISLVCNPDDSVTLSWAAGADIPGVPSAQDYGSIADGVLHLAANRSISWDTVNGEDMAFSSPYCFAWRGKIAQPGSDTATVSSGSWELYKTYPQTGSTDKSVTVSSGSWTQNPNAATSGTETETFTVSAMTEKTSTSTQTTSVVLNQMDAPFYTPFARIIIKRPYPISDYSSTYNTTGLDGSVGATTVLEDDYTLSLRVSSSSSSDFGKTLTVYTNVTTTAYTFSEQKTTSYSGISSPGVVSTTADSASVSKTATNKILLTGVASYSGTYSVTVSYNYEVSPNNLYVGYATGTLGISGATLTGASVLSSSATGGTTVSTSSSGGFTVTMYNATTAAANATIRLNYTTQTTGSDSYRTIVTGRKAGATSASVVSTTATRATVSMGTDGAYTVTMYYSSAVSRTAVISFSLPDYLTASGVAVISDGTTDASLNLVSTGSGYGIRLVIGNQTAATVAVPTGAWNALAVVRTGTLEAAFFSSGGSYMGGAEAAFSAPMPSPAASVEANGEQWCDYIFISSDADYDFASVGYEPGWDGQSLFYAAFSSDLQAGTVTSEDSLSAAIYRREGTTLSPIGVFGGTVHSIRDYSIRSGAEYAYEMFYVVSGTYSAGAESAPMCRRFRQHTLIEAEEDPNESGVYHPIHVWRFRDNLDAGSYTNQNQPVLLDNFTAYPLWQPHSPRAKTGTLTALLGRFENGVYRGETADDMNALFALSASVNPLFYRDMKGNLYLVRLAGPITQAVNNLTGAMEVSVSVPWVETGDADGAKIYTVEG